MKSFDLVRKSTLNRDELFKISTNVKNFHRVMPNYFKSLNILEENNSEQIVMEKISFLGKTLDVKTKHIVLEPNIHGVFILSGPLKNTSFIENYEFSSDGTKITILVNLEINGILKLIPFVHAILAKKMSHVMNEFLISAESSSKNKFLVS
ncbi:MAG: hypothetical protein ACRBBZ_02940 [Nitrosopumilus sp.]